MPVYMIYSWNAVEHFWQEEGDIVASSPDDAIEQLRRQPFCPKQIKAVLIEESSN